MSQKANHARELEPTEQPQGQAGNAGISPLPVNPDLVWDYDLPAEEEQDEAFRRWYVARVLTRGRAADVRALGLRTIYAYLPGLTLPDRIRRFWRWYFSFPDVRVQHGIPDPSTA
jgi:hypothetical protein